MQEAIQASQEGQHYALSPSIRVSHLVDCLVIGLSGSVSNSENQATIVTWTQDNLCSLVQLAPEAFEIGNLGLAKLRQLCSQLLQNVTADDELIR